jgi:hypothetical protein
MYLIVHNILHFPILFCLSNTVVHLRQLGSFEGLTPRQKTELYVHTCAPCFTYQNVRLTSVVGFVKSSPFWVSAGVWLAFLGRTRTKWDRKNQNKNLWKIFVSKLISWIQADLAKESADLWLAAMSSCPATVKHLLNSFSCNYYNSLCLISTAKLNKYATKY